MAKLFVDKTVEIDALPFKVWDVLTKPEYTAQWAPEFERGAPFRIESDWHIGAPVLWKDEDNQTVVQGKVTRLEPEKLLRFTVSDMRTVEEPAGTDEDGITFEITPRDARTLLHLRQGDFSSMNEGEKFRDMSDEVWDRVLPKIKRLAETPPRDPIGDHNGGTPYLRPGTGREFDSARQAGRAGSGHGREF